MDPILSHNLFKTQEIIVHYVKSIRARLGDEEMLATPIANEIVTENRSRILRQNWYFHKLGSTEEGFCQRENCACVNARISCIKGRGKGEKYNSRGREGHVFCV